MTKQKYKAGFPYLVDLSLSSVCPLAAGVCSVADKCYASPEINSTSKNAYGNSTTLQKFIHELHNAQTFELVFGGGSEPTTAKLFSDRDTDMKYPINLVSVLSMVRAYPYSFKVGVTTRNYNFHKQRTFTDSLRKIDSLAISINNPIDVVAAHDLIAAVEKYNKECYEYREQCKAAWEDSNVTPVTLYTQSVAGIYDLDVFVAMLEGCAKVGIKNITVLGYKDYGNGKGKQPVAYGEPLIDALKKLSEDFNVNIGADSILVRNFREIFKAKGVPSHYLVGEEGESSCYYEADTGMMRTSSFSGKSIPYKEGQLLDIFAKL